jgi:membrane protein required for colicin V production
MTIAAFDIICAVLAVILVVRCMLRGFIGEIMSMASVVLGILAAIFLYKNGAAFIRANWIEMKVVPEILAFAAIFLVVFLFVRIVEFFLKDIINAINLHGLDRLLGMFFGLLEAFVLICLILFILAVQPLFDPMVILQNSIVAQILLPLVSTVQTSFLKTAGV